MKTHRITALMLSSVLVLFLLAGCGNAPAAPSATPTPPEAQSGAASASNALVIAEQGIFSAGGITVTSEGTFDPENQWEESGAGQTAHVDHANVLYQIPAEETGLPLVFLHGYGQSRMGWMTTPDGREGWSDLFLGMGHGVFLLDQPRRGEAGATSVAGTISTKTLDQRWYTQFRIGRWEDGQSVTNEGSQFPNDPKSVNQFFRQMTPDTGMSSDMGGDFDNETVARAVAAAIDEVYERTGKKSILVTHSQGGGPGWTAVGYTDHIAAIVAIEPGGAPSVDSTDFQTLVEKQIPITMYFGDYIDSGDPAIQATGMWQMMRQTCYDFETAYTAQGGNCTVVDLPKEGITGNDHFMFQDLNNDVIADHVEAWVRENASGSALEYGVNAMKNLKRAAIAIMNGKGGNRFDPDGSATRAQVAVILRNCMEQAANRPDGSRVLAVYYSATGSTEAVARTIAGTLGAALFELVPTEPYTSADLDWTTDGSRVNREHENEALRHVALTSTTVENWEDYDTVFIGYPIWWGVAAWPVNAFVKANDFTGKTVIPFCTSSSSGLGQSGVLLEGMAGTGNWLTGQRFSSSVSSSTVEAWVNGLDLPAAFDGPGEASHSALDARPAIRDARDQIVDWASGLEIA